MARIGDIKKIKCLRLEEQEHYERLTVRQRKYCDYRVLGYGKKDAYVRAGYKASKSAAQAAYILEKKDELIASIISTRLRDKMSKGIYDPDSAISKQVDSAIANNQSNQIIEAVQNATPEVSKQIQFYRDIVAGKLKTKKETTNKDKAGIKSYKTEITDDIKVRMEARKELDRILGINKFIEIGNIEMGDITINIVDASKVDRSEDETPKGSIFKSIEEDKLVIISEDEHLDTRPNQSEREKPKQAFFKRNGAKV